MNGAEVKPSGNKGNSNACVCVYVYWQRLGQPCGSVTPGRLCWELKQIERCGILAKGPSICTCTAWAFTGLGNLSCRHCLSLALFHTLFLSLTVSLKLDTFKTAQQEKTDMTASLTDFKLSLGCLCKETIHLKILIRSTLTLMLFQPRITFFPPEFNVRGVLFLFFIRLILVWNVVHNNYVQVKLKSKFTNSERCSRGEDFQQLTNTCSIQVNKVWISSIKLGLHMTLNMDYA